MEFIMNNKTSIPDQQTRKRLIINLKKSRLDLQEFGLELEELLATLEKDVREQKLKRLEQNKSNLLV
jgi:hypothetical protein